MNPADAQVILIVSWVLVIWTSLRAVLGEPRSLVRENASAGEMALMLGFIALPYLVVMSDILNNLLGY